MRSTSGARGRALERKTHLDVRRGNRFAGEPGVIAEFGLDGVIATNTTLERPGYFAGVHEAGGLSGAPLRWRSTGIIHYLARATGGRLPIIGVGGITDAASAGEKLDAGATLVQVYTGLVYRGPFFARDLARALAARPRPPLK